MFPSATKTTAWMLMPPIMDQEVTSSPVVVKDDVWIGAGAVVLRGSRLERGCVVGAMSVVNGSVPAGGIVVGAPARLIGHRPRIAKPKLRAV